MTDLGAWAAEQYRVPGPTLMIDASLSGTLEGNNDTETGQDN